MIDPRFVWIGVLLALLGSLFYMRAVITGTVRPNLVTWSIWALMSALGFAAQLYEGVGLSALLTLSGGFGPLAVVLTSVVVGGRSYFHFNRLDYVCGFMSLAAIATWLMLDSAVLAILIVIAADVFAAVPTVRKAWLMPHTERAGYYVLVAVNGSITLLTLDAWSIADCAFPIYVTSIGVLIAVLVTTRKRQLANVTGARPTLCVDPP